MSTRLVDLQRFEMYCTNASVWRRFPVFKLPLLFNRNTDIQFRRTSVHTVPECTRSILGTCGYTHVREYPFIHHWNPYADFNAWLSVTLTCIHMDISNKREYLNSMGGGIHMDSSTSSSGGGIHMDSSTRGNKQTALLVNAGSVSVISVSVSSIKKSVFIQLFEFSYCHRLTSETMNHISTEIELEKLLWAASFLFSSLCTYLIIDKAFFYFCFSS